MGNAGDAGDCERVGGEPELKAAQAEIQARGIRDELLGYIACVVRATRDDFKVEVGAAFKQGKKLVSYGTVPKKCPKGGFPVKAELTFLGNVVVPASVKAPCPKK